MLTLPARSALSVSPPSRWISGAADTAATDVPVSTSSASSAW